MTYMTFDDVWWCLMTFELPAPSLQQQQQFHHHLFNNQSLELSSSSEIENIIQEEEEIFKKNPTVGLPEVSKLIDSTIDKRQGDQRKHSFLE